MFPLLKTGGLADVTGALPAAQIAEGWIPACCCRVSGDPQRGSGSAGGGQQGDIRRADDAAVWRL
jgi:hypothetical protein